MKFRCAILAAAAIVAVPLVAQAQLEPGYTEVYDLNIATNPNYSAGATYAVDNSGSIASGSFTRVAYELTLSGSTDPNSPNGTLWVSFDTLSTNANQLGVPTGPSGEFYQTFLSNMNVISNVPGIVNGTGITTGNIEFWPGDYGTGNANSVPGASGGTYDFGDQAGGGVGYGSMQVSNYGASQMLFSFNNWNRGQTADIGFGNNTGTSNQPDYTFQGNAGAYTTRDLSVWVQTVPEPSTVVLFGLGGLSLFAVARRRK